jgi:pyridoxamine 5'-phosphate oxidase
MDFQQLRNKHESAGINASEMPENPLDCLHDWFDLAKKHCPGRWFEPDAMTLATCDLSGRVTARIVLLKGITPEGIRFFTNYRSSKGQQLDINPQASVVFHWPYLSRQVRIEGSVEKTSRDESESYFHSRPRGSQIGALASQQSQPVEREALSRVVERLENEYEGKTIPLPENWGGYLLKPVRFEFWQGRLNRLHDRIVYEKIGDGWNCVRLSP